MLSWQVVTSRKYGKKVSDNPTATIREATPVTEPATAITRVETGSLYGPDRVAVIHAPSKAAPGSLAGLSRFLTEQGISVLPGYTGINKDPVLRLSDIGSDDRLHHLLEEEFPVWQRDNCYPPVSIDAESFEELDPTKALSQMSKWQQIMHQHGGTMAGLCYLSGDLAIMYDGLKHVAEETGKPISFANADKFKMATGGLYMTAAAILSVFARRDNPRSLQDLLRQMDTASSKQTDTPIDDERAEHLIGTVHQFLKKYPWETAGLISMTAAGAHITSNITHGKHLENISPALAMLALTIQVFMQERGGRDLFGTSKWFNRPDGTTIVDSMEHMKEKHPTMSPVLDAGIHLYEYVHEKPLRATARISQASHIGLTAAALFDNQLRGQTHNRINYRLMGASGIYFTGNEIQTRVSKGRGIGRDDVVSGILSYLDAHPEIATADKQTFRKRINRVAHWLSDQSEVVQEPGEILQTVEARLQHDNSIASHFTRDEQLLLASHPFVNGDLMRGAEAPTR